MAEIHAVSPLLDGLSIGKCIGSKHGVSCYIIRYDASGQEFILKHISVPESETKVQALLLSGAYSTEEEARKYYKRVAAGIVSEMETGKQFADCPNILPYEQYQVEAKKGTVGYDIYAVTEKMVSLKQYCGTVPMTHLRAVNLGIDVCAALDVIHKAGYLHQNVKPENIYVDDTSFLLGDLGLASMTDMKYASLPEQYIGDYTAPELFEIMSGLNQTADIYAIGMLLYRIYNGNHAPFEDEKTTPKIAEHMRISGTELPPPFFADYELAEIILKACAFNPERRYQTPAELKQALESYMQRNHISDTLIVPPIYNDPEPFENIAETENEPAPVRFADVTKLDEAFIRAFSPDRAPAVQEQTPEEPADRTGFVSAPAELPFEIPADTPAVEEPVAEEPVVEEPVVEEPAVEEPAVEEPVVEEPVIEEPVIEEPVVEEPVVEEPVVGEPVVEEPVVEEPVVGEPVVEEPVVGEPVVEEPVVEEPVVEDTEAQLENHSEKESAPLKVLLSGEELAQTSDSNASAGADEELLALVMDGAGENSGTEEEISRQNDDVPAEEPAPAPAAKKSAGLWIAVGAAALLVIALAVFLIVLKPFGGAKQVETEPVVTELPSEAQTEALPETTAAPLPAATAKVLSFTAAEAGTDTVRIAAETEGTAPVSVYCETTDNAVPVRDGFAVFTGLKSGTEYVFIPVCDDPDAEFTGCGPLTVTTLRSCNVTVFEAGSGALPGTVIIRLETDGEAELSVTAVCAESETVCPVSAGETELEGLLPGTDYRFTLSAADGTVLSGVTETAFTTAAEVRMALPEISEITQDGIAIRWEWLSEAPAEWTAVCADAEGAEIAVNRMDDCSVLVPEWTPGTGYTLTVRADNLLENNILEIPDTLVYISGIDTETADNGIRVSWNVPGAPEELRWTLQYAPVGTETEPVSVEISGFSVILTDLLPDTDYRFALSAEDCPALYGETEAVLRSYKASHVEYCGINSTNTSAATYAAPEGNNWDQDDITVLQDSFHSGDSVLFMVKCPNTGKYVWTVHVMYIVRDENGAPVHAEEHEYVWNDKWNKNNNNIYTFYDTLTDLPALEGSYTLDVYFSKYYRDFSSIQADNGFFLYYLLSTSEPFTVE